MELISIIFSGLALLAASVCLILLVQEKKRNQKRNAALTDLLRMEFDQVIAYIGECGRNGTAEHTEIMRAFKDNSTILRSMAEIMQGTLSSLADCKGKIENLEKGVVPDYNEAVEAKNAVDNFSRDIANLLNFDPLAAAREARNSRRRGGEVGE